MVKFIIEVSEDYIKEKADISNVTKRSESDKENPIRIIADLITFAGIEKYIDEGKTEFHISSKFVTEKERELFNNAISMVGSIALIHTVDKKIIEEELGNKEIEL